MRGRGYLEFASGIVRESGRALHAGEERGDEDGIEAVVNHFAELWRISNKLCGRSGGKENVRPWLQAMRTEVNMGTLNGAVVGRTGCRERRLASEKSRAVGRLRGVGVNRVVLLTWGWRSPRISHQPRQPPTGDEP